MSSIRFRCFSRISIYVKHVTRSDGELQLSIAGVVSSFARLLGGGPKTDEQDLSSRFAALGYDTDTLANTLLAVLVGCTVELSQGMSLPQAIMWRVC